MILENERTLIPELAEMTTESGSTDPNEIRLWSTRWQMVAERHEAEIREMSAEEKARRVSRMMDTDVSDQRAARREAEVRTVRRRWARLREFYGCLE